MFLAPFGFHGSASPTIPAGLIVFFNGSVTPDGWSRVSAADDRMIAVAGNTYAVGETGGTWSASGTLYSSTAGLHNYTAHAVRGGGNSNGYYPTSAEGDHSHSVGNISYAPARNKLLLIQALAESKLLPANAVILSEAILTGLSAPFSSGYIAGSATAETAAAESSSDAPSSAGNHDHYAVYPAGSWGNVDSPPNNFLRGTQPHSGHAVNLGTVTLNILTAALRAFTSAGAFSGQSGMMGLWTGAGIPAGWVEVVDFRDCFLKISGAGGGKTGSGNTLSVVNGQLESYAWSHHHYTGKWDANNRNTDSYTVTHSHTLTGDLTWLPPYWAAKLIKAL